MCTVTIHRAEGRLLLAMNRDERRSRAAELPPSRLEASGVAWIGPRDGQAGGTWIGASEFGVVACLLNNYQAPNALKPGKRSRGAIVPEVLGHGGLPDVLAWLRGGFDPSRRAPFVLLIASPEDARTFTWSGGGPLEESDPLSAPWAMLTSTSWNPEEVFPWRRERFEAWLRDGADCPEGLPSFHLLQPEGEAAFSPLMSREKTSTRSVTLARVEPLRGTAAVRYWPHPKPGEAGAGISLPLELVRAPGGAPSAGVPL